MPGSEVQELGQILRQARLRKGVSLMEAQQATKIRQSFLTALEDDDYSILPPPVYVRGFIKTYSNYLGLDGLGMVQNFDYLMESVAAGYDPYQPSYGASDSGGAALLPPAANPQMLAGLSQGEARMVERSAEMINLTSLDAPAEVEAVNDLSQVAEEKAEKVGLGSADSSGMPRMVRRSMGLQVPQKYILKPAIQPISKPSLYLPNFLPALIVLIILGAAFLLAYRGLVVPAAKDLNEAATPTPNVYSRATVTPLTTNQVGTKPAVSVAPGNNPPVAYTPDQVLLAPPAPVKETPGASLPSALLAVPVPTTTPILQTIKVDITVSGGPSWLTIVVDGQEKYAKLLAAGESLNYEGKRISVRAGAPGVVKIKVNGQDKQYALPGSDVITHTWDANGEDSIVK